MFDTMTLTKALGAFCGSLLVFLLIGWAGSALFYMGGGHGGAAEEQAYVIDTGEGEATAEVADAGPAFAEVFAAADAGAGENLNGVVDRAKAAVAGFGYSEAILAVADQAWTAENLNAFLENPKGYMPGTKMSFAGLPKVQDRANVIAYLASVP